MQRRTFLLSLAAAALPGAEKPLAGIFPIAQSPFTEDDRLDVETLVAELKFLDRCGTPGFVWPQLASEWATLSEDERLAGAEALCAAGRKLKPLVVIGVQAADAEKAARYARHAEKCGAGALIALPPPGRSDPKEVIAYYQEIGKAAPLPLIVQAVGAMSVDMIAEMARTVPTLAAVKDEAGNPLERIGELQAKAGRLKFFTGNHGRTLIDELLRGFAGTMPAAGFADLYVEAWNLWQGGKRREAVDAFGRAAVLIQEVNVYGTESLKYVLYRRGVFKNWRTREKGQEGKLNEAGRKSLDQILDLMKPYLKA